MNKASLNEKFAAIHEHFAIENSNNFDLSASSPAGQLSEVVCG